MDLNITPIFGTNGDDTLNGTGRSEVISGRQGNDRVNANHGSDDVYGGSGDDVLLGNSGNDVMYGGGGPSFADMSNLSITEDYSGTVTFLNEGAGYKNALGMYKVADDGTVYDVDILFPNASKVYSGGDLVPGVSSVNVDLNAGDQIGFFIVSNGYGRGADNQALLSDLNGTFELRAPDGSVGNLSSGQELQLYHVDAETGEATAVKSQYGYDIYHSAAFAENDYAPNPDAFPHTVGRINTVTGEIILGFEDLRGGGDKDYDDTVFSFDVGTSNAQVLDPNIAQQDSGDDVDDVVDGINGDPVPTTENDTLYGGSGDDQLFGMAGSDLVFGQDGNDQIWGNSGNDILRGGSANDTISGGSGNDHMFGDTGNDEIDGNSGNDTIEAGSGNDIVSGSQGDDHLYAGSGADNVDGGSGNDQLTAGSGNDTVKGGTGNDIAYGDSGSDRLDGGKGDDTLLGGQGADKAKGGSGSDHLYGGDGKDYLNGGSGSDVLTAGDGNDKLLGEKGSDLLTGGEGADKFIFRASDADGSVDQITDFSEEDTIELRGFGLNSLDDVLAIAEEDTNGVTLNLTGDDDLIIKDVVLSDLSDDWFALT